MNYEESTMASSLMMAHIFAGIFCFSVLLACKEPLPEDPLNLVFFTALSMLFLVTSYKVLTYSRRLLSCINFVFGMLSIGAIVFVWLGFYSLEGLVIYLTVAMGLSGLDILCMYDNVI